MGVASWASENCYVFNIESGEVLNFDSVCDSDAVKDSLYNYVINNIGSNSAYTLDDNWKNSVNESVFELDN